MYGANGTHALTDVVGLARSSIYAVAIGALCVM